MPSAAPSRSYDVPALAMCLPDTDRYKCAFDAAVHDLSYAPKQAHLFDTVPALKKCVQVSIA